MKTTQLSRIIITGILIISVACCVPACSRKEGTTKNIDDIVKDRCDAYNTDTSQSWDCSDIWSKFKEGFANKAPCGLPEGSYSAYIASTHIAIPRHKTLLWSGKDVIKDKAMNYSRSCGFVTLGDTLTGCLPDELKWCGKENEGIDYKNCKDCTGDELSSSTTLWKEVSQNIAKISSGVVTVMLSGKRKGGAYQGESFFAKYEVPNLEYDRVTAVRILLRDKTTKENCNSETSTIQHLKNNLRDQSTRFNVECIDDENEINKICTTSISEGPPLGKFYPCANGRINKPITTIIIVSICLSLDFMFDRKG